MDTLLLEYGWVLLVLIGLEGLLAADNAVVLAVMVKHLPKTRQKKALFYGLAGAFAFRFAALFVITLLVNIWQVQALGAAYLLFISIKHIYSEKNGRPQSLTSKMANGSSFWMTVLKIELADIAFALDSMLAAVALAVTLPHLDLFGVQNIGGINSGQFMVILTGGLIGVIIMRFAAHKFVQLLEKYPQLELAAFAVVGWVGVKLLVMTLAHEKLGILPHDFPHSAAWTLIFWLVLVGIVISGTIFGLKKNR